LVDSSVAHVVLSNVFKARKMLWQGRPAEGPSIKCVGNLERKGGGGQNDLEFCREIEVKKCQHGQKGVSKLKKKC
jgi:hypothetical protein